MKKLTTTEFIDRSKAIHGNKYDYSKTIYFNVRTLLKITCKKHGNFLQYPKHHFSQKSGCPKCGTETKPQCNFKSIDKFIEDANKIHNFRYNYSKTRYSGIFKKVKILCKLHGEFFQTPNDHLDNHGCPKCNSSKGEEKIINFFKQHKIKYLFQHWFNNCRSNIGKHQPLKFDFYVPSKKLLIEYDGKQHFMEGGYFNGHLFTKQELKELRGKDKIKTDYAKQNKLKLLRIKYTQFNKIDNILRKIWT